MAAASLLDAVTEGLAETVPAAPVVAAEPVVETPAEEVEAEVETPAEGEEEAEADGEEAEGEEAGEEEAEAEGEKETAKTAEEIAAAEAAAKAAKPDEKPGEKKADDKGAKKDDPVNDPIPAQVSERTRTRIQTLVSKVKEQEAVVQAHTQIMATFNDTGATPEEFGRMVTYMKQVHSSNVEDRRAAYNTIMAEMAALAESLGEVVPGKNALEGHDDLLEALQQGTIDVKLANELAAKRRKEAVETRVSTERSTAAQRQQEQEAATNAGIADLNALGVELKKTDKDYDRKAAILIPSLKSVFARIPPSEWKATFQSAYTELKLPAVARPVTPAAGAKPGQPMRANKQPSGNGAKAPGSMLEAMNAALAGA